VTLAWDAGQSFGARARVEIAVGVLMELSGWEATKARSHPVLAAHSAGAPVEKVAEAILALGAEHPKQRGRA
jgi:hypothetical protein